MPRHDPISLLYYSDNRTAHPEYGLVAYDAAAPDQRNAAVAAREFRRPAGGPAARVCAACRAGGTTPAAVRRPRG